MAAYIGLDLASPVDASIATSPRARAPVARSLRAVDALGALAEREREHGRRNAWRLALGNAIVLLGAAAMAWLWCALCDEPLPNVASREGAIVASIIGGFTVLAFLIASITGKNSRADLIEQFLNRGSDAALRSHDHEDNPLLKLAFIVAFVGMLYGAFITLDATKDALLRRRLAGADRYRAADILAQLIDRPQGIDPRFLLRHGEDVRALRETVAYLLTFDWADISRKGDHLVLVSPARRNLRAGWNVL